MKLNGSQRLGVYGALLLLGVAMLSVAGGSAASAQTITHTFPGVHCQANVNGTILDQVQDITIGIVAPDSVAPGETFTVSFPGGSAGLPTKSNGLNITEYANLFQTVQINGTNFNNGSIVNPGSATVVPNTSQATTWAAATTYAVGVYVVDAGVFYQSLTAANTGHIPASSPANWAVVPRSQTEEWSSTKSYALNFFVTSGGIAYKSLTAANLNHPPASSPANWVAVPTTTPEDASLPLANQFKYGQPGPFAPGNGDVSLTATLTTPEVSVQATAPASGAVTINMVSLTTQVKLNGVLTAAVTCAVPTDTLVTIPVGSAATTTTAPATTTTAPATTTTAPATTTTAPATTTTGPATTTTAPATTTTGPATTTTAPATTTTGPATTTTAPATTTTAPATTTTAPATTTTAPATTTTVPVGVTTTTAAPTTTTQGPTTTTTVPAKQRKTHKTMTDANDCTSSVPALGLDDTAVVTVTFSTDTFPEPHLGDPIQFSNTKLTIKIPADLLQVGVDAGIITDKMQVTSTIHFVLDASNATPASHDYVVKNAKTQIHVVNGQAQPLTDTFPLPAIKWTPKNAELPVFWSEKSMSITSKIPVLGGITAIFSCKPHGPAQFGVAAEGTALTNTQGTTPPTTSTTVAAAETSSGTLPQTGASALLLLTLAAICIDLGLAAVAFTRRRWHVTP